MRISPGHNKNYNGMEHIHPIRNFPQVIEDWIFQFYPTARVARHIKNDGYKDQGQNQGIHYCR